MHWTVSGLNSVKDVLQAVHLTDGLLVQQRLTVGGLVDAKEDVAKLGLGQDHRVAGDTLLRRPVRIVRQEKDALQDVESFGRGARRILGKGTRRAGPVADGCGANIVKGLGGRLGCGAVGGVGTLLPLTQTGLGDQVVVVDDAGANRRGRVLLDLVVVVDEPDLNMEEKV